MSPNDLAISLGYARTLGETSLGVSGKFIRSTLLDTAQTQALDLGLLSPGFWEDKIKLAFVATNLGGQLKFEQEGAGLPLTFRAGSRLRASDLFLFALDGVFPKDNGPYAALGVECQSSLTKRMQGALRAGYNTRTLGDLEGFSGVSLGLGLILERLSVDYAFVSLGALGLTHRFSLSFRWGDRRQP